MKFQVEGITQDLVGQKFTAKFVIYSTDIKLGTFIVSEAPQEDDDNVKSVVAYDLMSKFDVDVTEWYNDIDFDAGVTLKELRESLCIYCGVPYEASNLPNDNIIVKRTISTNQLIGRDVLKSCEELNGCFGHMNEDGKLKHVVLSKTNPVDTLDSTVYESLEFEEYTTDPISKVQIRQEDGDVGAYSGTGDNCYTITGNFLVYGKTASELATIANNVATNILGITYRPFECTGQGLPYQEMGDYITLSGNETVNTYILHSTLTGTQILDGSISAKGSKTLTEDNGLNVQIIQLQGKSNILKRTVEGISNSVSAINNEVGSINENITELKQTSNEISSTVSSVQTTVTEINNKAKYELIIVSSNGNIFKNGDIQTTLTAIVKSWDTDITDTIDANQLIWTRVSNDTTGDKAWNSSHSGGSKSIVVTSDDVKARATFFCDLIDTTTRLSLL